jgi:hypothetical protein
VPPHSPGRTTGHTDPHSADSALVVFQLFASSQVSELHFQDPSPPSDWVADFHQPVTILGTPKKSGETGKRLPPRKD